MRMNNESINKYVNRFREVYDGTPWYGENIVSKLNDLTGELAFTRPREDVHSVAEVVAHMTYWRQSLINRLNHDTSFKASVESEDNWRDLALLRADGWEKVRANFDASQQALVETLTGQTDAILAVEYAKDHTFEHLIQGVIEHDIYHLGQIGLIRKMLTTSGH